MPHLCPYSLTRVYSTGPYGSFHPVIDNKLFVEPPTISLENGRFQNVPAIVG